MKLLYPHLQRLADYVFTQYRDFDQHCEVSDTDVSDADCACCNKDSYYGGKPAYGCNNFKRAYLWRILFAHIAQSEQPLSRCVCTQIGKESNVRALSFGGGPGTEAIALMNQLSKRTGSFNILFDNLEAEASWQPIYDDLVNHFAGYLKNVTIKAGFYSSTTTASLSADPATAYHVVFASWLLSEWGDAIEREKLLTQLLDATRPDGYLVVMDRKEGTLVGEIDQLLHNLGKCTEVGSDLACQGYAGIRFPDELKETFMPKLNYQTAYWVMRRS